MMVQESSFQILPLRTADFNRAGGNIYYAVNSTAFAIGYSVTSSLPPMHLQLCYSEQAAYTTRTINVPSTGGSIADVDFNVGFTHSYLSMLRWKSLVR
jgi:hypothetical protein